MEMAYKEETGIWEGGKDLMELKVINKDFSLF